LSAAGVAGFFEVYRPYFVVGAVGLLGAGIYTVYLRKKACAPGAACATPDWKLRLLNQVMLWVAVALVACFVFFPNYAGHVLEAVVSPPPARMSRAYDDLTKVRFRIEGMTCAGCAVTLQNALAKLPGVVAVDVDYAARAAVVRHEVTRPVRAERVIEAARDAGYDALPVETERH